MSFSDGSAIRLTVAKYYTPTGRSIQKPYKDGREEYYNDISYRYINGEFESADSISFSDSLKYITPGGKTVYGGGGIMPDVFVPMDTTFFSNYYSRFINLGLSQRFAFYYTDIHRNELEQFSKTEEFLEYLDYPGLKKEIIDFAESKGLKYNPSEFSISEKVILTNVKAFITRNVIDNKGFYPIISETDEIFSVAVDTLSAI